MSDDESMEIHYGKIGAKFYGPMTIIGVLIVLLIGLIGFGIVRFADAQALSNRQHEEQIKRMDTVISKQEIAIGSNLLWQQVTKDGFDVNNYILLQSPEKRAELAKKMEMPESLRRKIRGER